MYGAKGPFDLELNPVIDLFQLDDRFLWLRFQL